MPGFGREPALGEPERKLPDAMQSRMASAFGGDFSSVAAHEGAQSNALGAQAYTQGSDVAFGAGAYGAAESGGRELIGHELAHVVQQREGVQQARADLFAGQY